MHPDSDINLLEIKMNLKHTHNPFRICRHLIFICLIDILVVSCNAQSKCNCGMIKYGLKKYDSLAHNYITDEYFWQNPRIWYRDSFAIEEIKELSIIQSNGKIEKKVTIGHFTFIDIRKSTLYDYSSFSDTAKLIRKYIQADSIPVPGGWSFYDRSHDKEYPGYEPLVLLPDTIIGKVKLKRRMTAYTNPDSEAKDKSRHVSIMYFRCDIKKSMFNLSHYFSRKIGCPCVRIDHPGAGNSSSQIEFVTDKLTPQEIKIFNIWEKNAKRSER